MRFQSRQSGLAGAISVLLLLEPVAALSGHRPHEDPKPPATNELLISQRGGGSRGGGSRGGGSRGGGSRSSSRSSSRSNRGRTGFSSYSGSRQGTRQNTSSNRQTSRTGARDQRQTSRGDNRDTRQYNRSNSIDSRQQGRNNRTDFRQSSRNDRANNRRDTVNNWDRYGRGWYSGSNWSNNRPWNNGWYGRSYYNNWGWYPGRAAAWGIAGMATFGAINNLVNSAQASEVSYIEVPNSEYALYYPSVTATGDVVSFEADNGYGTMRFSANCRNGTLNGGTPLDANQAQLLNAACQVAFGQ